jgi:hypothetical protein
MHRAPLPGWDKARKAGVRGIREQFHRARAWGEFRGNVGKNEEANDFRAAICRVDRIVRELSAIVSAGRSREIASDLLAALRDSVSPQRPIRRLRFRDLLPFDSLIPNEAGARSEW